MITFHNIRFKNFLSSGNNFTDIQLDKNSTTLIIGDNGAGKSTMLDALTFSLFGRPFRNINKNQLINSINERGAVVECEFSIGSKTFLVRRGIKPNIFDIIVNDQHLEQRANVRDFQEFLEKQILKLNYKSFTQIIVLGNSSFVPFMQLKSNDRRAIIEDLLDIQIFSIMNGLLKNYISDNKQVIENNLISKTMIENKIELKHSYIERLKQKTKKIIESNVTQIDQSQKEASILRTSIADTNKNIEACFKSINDNSDIETSLNKLTIYKQSIERNVNKEKNTINFFESNNDCPTCKQNIDHQFKHKEIQTKHNQIKKYEEGLEQLSVQIASYNDRISTIQQVQRIIQSDQSSIQQNNSSLNAIEQYIQKIEKEIDKLKHNDGDITAEKKELKSINIEYDNINKQRIELINYREVLELVKLILRDDGIKTKIIKQYLPIMNKLINRYLQEMDFFVSFHLDENFDETIKSRYRDDFTYTSFSEGEKMRIDLALLFTWRSIAKLKNSTNTNLLILDEVFDSSLDTDGTEMFMKILDGLRQNTNVFVISHKGDLLFDKFEHNIKFEKKKNFSVIV